MRNGGGFRFETAKSSKERTTPVSARVSPTDRVRARIDALFAEELTSPKELLNGGAFMMDAGDQSRPGGPGPP